MDPGSGGGLYVDWTRLGDYIRIGFKSHQAHAMVVENIKRVEGKGHPMIVLTYIGEYPEDKDIIIALVEHYGYTCDYVIVDLETTEEGGTVYINEVGEK